MSAPHDRVIRHSDLFGDSIAVAVAVAFALLVTHLLVSDHRVVDVEIVNPTAFELSISATDAGRHGWAPVATIEAQTTETIRDVLDQGPVWIVSFRGQGRSGGEVRIEGPPPRTTVWKLTVPAVVEQRLRARGAVPGPLERPTN